MKLILRKPLKFTGVSSKSISRSELTTFLKQSLNVIKKEKQNEYFKYKRDWRKYSHRLDNE